MRDEARARAFGSARRAWRLVCVLSSAHPGGACALVVGCCAGAVGWGGAAAGHCLALCSCSLRARKPCRPNKAAAKALNASLVPADCGGPGAH